MLFTNIILLLAPLGTGVPGIQCVNGISTLRTLHSNWEDKMYTWKIKDNTSHLVLVVLERLKSEEIGGFRIVMEGFTML